MDVIEAIKKRGSARSYQQREIPQRDLEEILDAARVAPSAKNRQLWKFVVVTDPEEKKALCQAAYNQHFISDAPVVIAGVSLDITYIMACGVPSGYVDLAIALDHITLAATEKGLGTCWIGHFNQEQAQQILGIPSHYVIVSLVTMGYPTSPLMEREKKRKTLKEVICYNRFHIDDEGTTHV